MVFSGYNTQDINSLHTKKRPIRAFFSDFILFKLFAKPFLRRLQKIAYGFRHSAVCKGLSRLDGLICSQYVKEMFVLLV